MVFHFLFQRRSIHPIRSSILPPFISHKCTLQDIPNKTNSSLPPKSQFQTEDFPCLQTTNPAKSYHQSVLNGLYTSPHHHRNSDFNTPNSHTANLGQRDLPSSSNQSPPPASLRKLIDEPAPEEDWGELTHKFNFVSAYKHYEIERLRPHRIEEVSTHHGGCHGSTVDYIFFTGLCVGR